MTQVEGGPCPQWSEALIPGGKRPTSSVEGGPCSQRREVLVPGEERPLVQMEVGPHPWGRETHVPGRREALVPGGGRLWSRAGLRQDCIASRKFTV